MHFFLKSKKYMNSKTVKIALIWLLLAIIVIAIINNYFVINLDQFSNNWFFRVSSAATTIVAIFTIFAVLFAYFSMKASFEVLEEMKKQTEPAISVKVVPDRNNFDLLNLVIKNTGGGPAYDISIKFIPDLPYKGTFNMLNDLPKLQNISILDKNETIEFFLVSSFVFEEKNNKNVTTTSFPKQTQVVIKYGLSPKLTDGKIVKEKSRVYNINIFEDQGQKFVVSKNINNLVNEIEELKQGILILLSRIENNGNKELHNGKYIRSTSRRQDTNRLYGRISKRRKK